MALYARVAVARDGTGWTVSGNDGLLNALATFPTCAAGSALATYFGLGTASSGAGQLLFFGPLSQPIAVAPTVPPKLAAGTKVSNSSSDAMPNAAASALLELILNNVDWSATGLRGSLVAGSLYLSLHSASPGQSGNQASNEIAYT